MNLLFLTGEYPPMRGGVGDYTAYLAAPLAAQGHGVTVLTQREAAGATTLGVAVLPRMARWGVGEWRGMARLAQRADVVHIQYQAAAFGMGVAPQLMAAFLRRVTKRPVVITFHDLRVPYLFPKAGPLREKSMRFLARSASAVVATNAEDAATLRGWGVERRWQIPIGANLPLDLPPQSPVRWRDRWRIPHDAPLLSHFGFVNRSKDTETLLRAVAALRPQWPDLHLLMIGERVGASDHSNRAYADEIEALAEELGLREPFLQWTGSLPAEEVVAGLRAAEVVVLPYRDGASLRRGTLAAPLALGRPVVTTQPTTPIPFLKDGDNIRFTAAESPTALSSAIAALLADGALRERITAGAATLSHHFDWAQIAAQHHAMYQELLSDA
ncbi:MAG: glycosyltransferase [Anaerolineales bacterium]|nr:glycosyltransferase [Anaerolineales bacterium]MCB9128706.1 glycosyltransferase [Ardenticatenales bacterium]MCB9172616.1 glycosyltransferase [Ardenticatenales bacterium]